MKKLQTTRYRLSLHKNHMPSGIVRFAYFTDLHNCCHEEEAQVMLSVLEREKPDFVLCGGDVIVARPGKPVEESVFFMKKVKERYPLYCAMGNHEYRARIYPETYGTMYASFVHPLLEAGVSFLDNDSASFLCHGIPMQVLGLSIDRMYYRRFHHTILPTDELDRIFGAPDQGAVSVLLAHNPLMLQTYLDWKADLTLCGHYHGGIMRFGDHHGLVSPDFRLFPGNAYGLFEENGRHCIVSSGCGEHSIPVRIHNPREIVLVELDVNGAQALGV